jgi:hypothetical protein
MPRRSDALGTIYPLSEYGAPWQRDISRSRLRPTRNGQLQLRLYGRVNLASVPVLGRKGHKRPRSQIGPKEHNSHCRIFETMASILPDAELTALSFADEANGLDFPIKGSVTVIVLHGPQPRPGSCPAGLMAIAGLRW